MSHHRFGVFMSLHVDLKSDVATVLWERLCRCKWLMTAWEDLRQRSLSQRYLTSAVLDATSLQLPPHPFHQTSPALITWLDTLIWLFPEENPASSGSYAQFIRCLPWAAQVAESVRPEKCLCEGYSSIKELNISYFASFCAHFLVLF